jgi:hypothetical protein
MRLCNLAICPVRRNTRTSTKSVWHSFRLFRKSQLESEPLKISGFDSKTQLRTVAYFLKDVADSCRLLCRGKSGQDLEDENHNDLRRRSCDANARCSERIAVKCRTQDHHTGKISLCVPMEIVLRRICVVTRHADIDPRPACGYFICLPAGERRTELAEIFDDEQASAARP